MSALDTAVYIVECGAVVETTIGACDGYVDLTTTPLGVAPRYHVRGNELWSWGYAGNFPKLVEGFDTEEEAQARLDEHFEWDFWNCADICAFTSRQEAEESLQHASDG